MKARLQLPETRFRMSMAAPATKWQLAKKGIAGVTLSWLYWLLAYVYRVPGLHFRWRSVLLALRIILSGKPLRMPRMLFQLLFWPLDSTRYFEFDFMWRTLPSASLSGRYLDVSSPRLFPILLLLENPRVSGVIINPDPDDIRLTASLVTATGMTERVSTREVAIESASLDHTSFDLITCMSVLEHIKDDRSAVERMWSLVRPEGRLVITVPCAARSSVQLSDVSLYGSPMDEKGWAFFQYVYDEPLLNERIFSVTGPPSKLELFGEKEPGVLSRYLAWRRRDHGYPLWKEPLFVGSYFRKFAQLSDLPGEGVIGLEFVRPVS